MEMKRENPKGLATLATNIGSFSNIETKVGWFETAVYPDGRPVAAVAAGNELGIASRKIPPRPFMRPTVSENENSTWPQKSGSLAGRVLEGKMTAFDAMEAFGAIVEGDIAKTISSITSPPLSPITLGARKYRSQGKKVTGATIGEIARKLKDGTLDISGVNDKPLVDSAHMINTLTHTTSKA